MLERSDLSVGPEIGSQKVHRSLGGSGMGLSGDTRNLQIEMLIEKMMINRRILCYLGFGQNHIDIKWRYSAAAMVSGASL